MSLKFKAEMKYKNIDFNADKVKQHEAVREAMNSASLQIHSFYASTFFWLRDV